MKEKNSVSGSMIISVFFIFAIAMIFITILLSNKIINTDKYFKDYNTFINNNLLTQLDKQEEIDNKIKDISKNGNYSLNKPYLFVNPYGINPLSAIVIFNTIKSEKISLYINDEYMGTTDSEISHIIPIIGLYSNRNNSVTLESSSGEKTNLTITTEILNDDINEFDIENLSDKKKSSVIIMGDIKNNKSIIRGFDKNGNLNLNISFGYLKGFNLSNNHLLVNYNNRIYNNNNIKGLQLEIDYLGRIYSINTDASSLNSISNLALEGKEYITMPINYYDELIENYSLAKIIDNNKYTDYEEISTDSFIRTLDSAPIYNEDYDISLMGEYLNVDFGTDVTLLLVNKYDNLTYSYDVKSNALLKVKMKDDISLFVKKDNKYYTLLTVLEA